MENETESKCKNKRRFGDGYCQIHLEVPKEFKEKLEEQSRKRRLTKAGYVTEVLRQAFDNDGTLPNASQDSEKIDMINGKIDLIISYLTKNS